MVNVRVGTADEPVPTNHEILTFASFQFFLNLTLNLSINHLVFSLFWYYFLFFGKIEQQTRWILKFDKQFNMMSRLSIFSFVKKVSVFFKKFTKICRELHSNEFRFCILCCTLIFCIFFSFSWISCLNQKNQIIYIFIYLILRKYEWKELINKRKMKVIY